jgi:HEAT repeat protein
MVLVIDFLGNLYYFKEIYGGSMSENETTNQSGQVIHGSQVNAGRDVHAGQIGDDIHTEGGDYVRGDKHITILRSGRVKAPSEACLIHYLQNVQEVVGPPEMASAEVKRLWKVDFRARHGELTKEVWRLRKLVDHVHSKNRNLKSLQRVVILADIGMGKTPALYHLRQEHARISYTNFKRWGHKLKRENFVIPIMIALADLKAGIPMLTLIRDAFNARIQPEPNDETISAIDIDQTFMLLEKYTCLFLFDGIEDLLGNTNLNGVQILRQFMESYPEHRYVLTCWTVAYRDQLGIIDKIFLEDLGEEEVMHVMGEDEYNQLNASLHPLIRNRSLLNIVLDLGPVKEHIYSKGHLIREQNRKRLQESEQEAPYLDMIAHLLEELAYAILQEPAGVFSEQQMMQFISAYLKAWNEPYRWRQVADFLYRGVGVLERNEMRFWIFREHVTCAYFAAGSIMQHPDRLDTLYNATGSNRWPEIFTLLIGLLDDPRDLCYELIDRDVFIAAQCIRFSGRTVEDRVIDAVVDALIEQMAKENSNRRRRIVMHLGESGHPRALEALLRTIQRDWSSYVVLGVIQSIVLWMNRNPDSAWPALQAQLDRLPYGSLMGQAIKLAGRFEDADLEPERWLAIVAEPGQHRLVPGMAVMCMGFGQTAACRDALLTLLQRNDLDEFLFWCGIEALTLYKQSEDQKKIAEVAKEVYMQPADPNVRVDSRRSRAVYILGWINQESSIPGILSNALADDDPYVRRYAINAMARLDIVNARAQIEQQLQFEDDPRVLREIALALGAIGDMNTIALLTRHMHDEHSRTRHSIKLAINEIRDRHEMRIAVVQ